MTETEPETAIQQLDPTTIERIAAGEVVERPASVVKELLENSLDAGASRIAVSVENGGKDRIRVTDDGTGMTEADVRAAVKKHTTSKIADIGDLEAGIETLGFRGEALAAISAVSRVRIRTKPRGGTRGTELSLEGGIVDHVEPAGCPEGTTIDVTDLFYNVPARRKYLKRDATEFSHIATVASGYALANPDVAITLEHNDRETFATPGRNNLEETLLAVYGREVAQAMVPIDTDAIPEGPLKTISGVISHPETNRSTPEYLRIYINGRYVSAKVIRNAVLDAYDTQLSSDRYPFAVLFCELPSETIDVNVHPRKQEVRFTQEESVRLQVREAVKTTLLEEGLIRTVAPRGRSAPEQATIEPEPTSEGEASATPTEPNASTAESATTADSATRSNSTTHGNSDTDTREQPPARHHARSSGELDEPEPPTADDPTDHSSATDQKENSTATTTLANNSNSKFTAPADQATLAGEAEAATEPDLTQLPPLRVLGQVHDTYLVAETPDSLLLIDQHTADERVTYERLRERFAGETQTQTLAAPVELDLTAEETALFEEHTDALARLGFYASQPDEDENKHHVQVTTVPVLIAEAAEPTLLRDALATFAATGEPEPGAPIDTAADALLADLACYPSLTGKMSLTEGSIIDLLEALDACDNPYACPHGRPVIIELSENELAERFERDYPDHHHRREE